MVKKRNENFMPLGLLSLAANAQIWGNEVKIYKPTIPLINKADFKLVATDILKNKPGLIGFSTWCITYPASLLIAKEIKAQAPDIPVIFGGPQASIVAEKTKDNFPFIDFILAGEADLSFQQFINECRKPNPDFSFISGLTFRNASGRIQHNKINGTIDNLDELPIPAYELVPELNWLKLDVGRGCPFQCTYCSTSDFFSKKYRVKSASKIFTEMMQAYQSKGITSFSFAHDMFTLNRKFVFELCDKLISIKQSEGIEFKWNCSARIDCVSKEMLIKMKAAGCSDIFFGIETGSERMQQIIKKNLDVTAGFKIADICRKEGIRMHASFIIGFPEETQEDLNKTLKSALILATKGALTQVSELTLLPGTPLYNNNFKKLKFDGKFSNFSRNFCTVEEIKLIKKYPEIFSSFYYLPVKTIKRNEMLLLRFFINKSKDFRNTLFLLSELIETDINNVNLPDLFKNVFKRSVNEKNDYGAIEMQWIKVIENYIIKNNSRIDCKFLRDIFTFEAYSALLKTLFSAWELIQTKIINIKLRDNFTITPTPIWKVITVNYKLENILPSENNWEENMKKSRKGRYSYLLLAESQTKCRRFKINATDEYLLNIISDSSIDEFVAKVGLDVSREEIIPWLKKMQRIGVIEIRCGTNETNSEHSFVKPKENEYVFAN